METGRVLIDTEDLRELVRYVGGAVEQLGDIRLDLIRAVQYLDENPVAYQEYGTVLAGIDSLGSVLSQDRAALIGEVTAVEGEEGMPVPEPWVPPAPVGPVAEQDGAVFTLPVILGAVIRHLDGPVVAGPTPPPGPWNVGWVTAAGVIPPGAPMATMEFHDEFGTQWAGSTSGRSGSASGSASAGGWIDGEAEAGRSGSGYRASASGSVGVRASVQGQADTEVGDLKLGVSGGASAEAQASGEGHASIGDDGLHAGASGSASASAEAHGEVHASVPGAEASVQGHAEAHAEAHAQGSVDVGPDGIGGSVGAGASAGVSAGYTASADGPAGTHVGVGGNVKAGVGIDVDAGAEIGWDKVGFNFDVGAALGLGVGFSFDFSFSPEDLVDGIGDVISDPLGAIGDVADAVGDVLDTAGEVLDTIGDAAEAVDSALTDLFGPGPDPTMLTGSPEALPASGTLPTDPSAALPAAGHSVSAVDRAGAFAADWPAASPAEPSTLLPAPPAVPLPDLSAAAAVLPPPPVVVPDLAGAAAGAAAASGIGGFLTWPPALPR